MQQRLALGAIELAGLLAKEPVDVRIAAIGELTRPRSRVRGGAGRELRGQGHQEDGRECGVLHRASCRPMKSRIIEMALSESALAWPMKPWRAPGKCARSIAPPACW
jgi:hypothetical protein